MPNHASPNTTQPQSTSFTSFSVWVALSVLIIGFSLTFYAAQRTQTQVEETVKNHFDSRANLSLTQINQRLNDYRSLILSMQGLFIATEQLDRKVFHDYCENLQLKQRLPGMQAISFQRYVRDEDKEAYIARVRHDVTLNPVGYPDFTIKPEGSRPEYVVIEYLEPMQENLRAFGIDALTQAANADAIRLGMESGQYTISTPFKVAQAPDGPPRLVLRAPVYRKGTKPDTITERRNNLLGFVVLTFVADTSFRDFFSTLTQDGERIVIEDIGPNPADSTTSSNPRKSVLHTTIFDSGALQPQRPQLSKATELSFGGRQWKIVFSSDDSWVQKLPTHRQPLQTLVGGTFISFLLAALYLALARAQARATKLATHMTQDLRLSQQRLHTLAELSSEWFWETDVEGRFTRIDGGSMKKLTLPIGNIIGKTRWELSPNALTEEKWEAHRQQLAAQQPFEMEYQVTDLTGHIQWAQTRGVPTYDGDGKFVGYYGTAQNITTKKQAQEEIARKSAVLATTLEHMDQGISVVDADLKLVAFNTRFVKLLDFPPSLIYIGAKLEDCLRFNASRGEYGPGDKQAQVQDLLDKAKNGVAHQFKRTRPDGTVLNIGSNPLPTGGVVTTYSDITEQERNQEKLRSERDFNQKLIESVPGIFSLVDKNGKYLMWNKNYEDVTGCNATELTRSHPLKFFLDEDKEMMERSTEELFREGRSSIEVMFITKNGIPKPYFFTGVRIDLDGKPAIIGLGIDITERKQAEQAVQNLNDTLEQRVRLRTAQLEASNKELEAFSYSVSHDLRAPLRALDGFSLILEQDYSDKLDQEGLGYLGRIRSASQRMGDLIDDLLNLARFSRQELNLSLVNLSQIATDIRNNVEEQDAEERLTQAKFETPSTPRSVHWKIAPNLQANADPILIKLVIDNLIRNAWKFTAERDDAHIEFGCKTSDGQTVFYVMDNGTGFEMAYVGKIFEPFERLHDLKRFSGTGIGLAIVQRVLRRHGGQVWAESVPNEGSIFYFSLP